MAKNHRGGCFLPSTVTLDLFELSPSEFQIVRKPIFYVSIVDFLGKLTFGEKTREMYMICLKVLIGDFWIIKPIIPYQPL